MLINLPTRNLQAAVLTGARSPDLLLDIMKSAKTSNGDIRTYKKVQQDYPLIPDAVRLESKEIEAIKDIANEVGINFADNPALNILTHSPSIDDILKSNDFEPRDDLNWRRRVFSTKELRFISCDQSTTLGGNVRLAEYIHPQTRRMENWLWKGDHALDNMDRDFGRYVVLASEGVNVVFFDHLHNCLAVPESVPLPMDFARALTLCSGIAPLRSTVKNSEGFRLPIGLRVKIYTGIPIEFCNVLCNKLSQEPQKLTTADLQVN